MPPVREYIQLKVRTKDVLEGFLPYVGHAYTAVELKGEE